MAEIDASGGLYFKSSLNNDQLDAAINESVRRIQGLSDGFVQAGDTIDARISDLSTSLDIQKKVVADLDAQYRSLRKEQSSFDMGTKEHDQYSIAIKKVSSELAGERDALVEIKRELRLAAQESINAGQSLESLGGSQQALEVLRRSVSGSVTQISLFKDSTVKGSGEIDKAFGSIGAKVQDTFAKIDEAYGINKTEMNKLLVEYDKINKLSGDAYRSGDNSGYQALSQKKRELEGEINVRKRLISEIGKEADALEVASQKFDAMRDKAQKVADAQVRLKTELNQVQNRMAQLAQSGERNSAEYAKLTTRAQELTAAIRSANQQVKTLTSVKGANLQGFVTGLSGLAGGFSAATGAMSMFAGENDNLQKIMVKVQSLMAVTIGLQQVQQTLNKDSAFQLITLTKIKNLYATSVRNTGTALIRMGASAGVARVAATALMGTLTLGLGVAITGIITLISKLVSRTREAKKMQEEFAKSVAESAYKPIGAIEQLSAKWKSLGNDLDAKRKFVDENKKAFDELGVAIRDVSEAEKLLSSEKHKQAFIDAQIAKAKAMIYAQQATEKIKKQMELEAQIATMSDTKINIVSTGYGSTSSYEVENTEKTKKKKELEILKSEIKEGYSNATWEESEAIKKMEETGVAAINGYKDGTIGALEKAIQEKQDKLKGLDPNGKEFSQTKAEIAKYQKELDRLQDKKTSKVEKDPFLERLEKQKAEYQRYFNWVNSGDQVIAKAAETEFSGLLKEGASYIKYLENQRDQLLSIPEGSRTKGQNSKLGTLNNQIADETKKTVIDAFDEELSEQIANAKSVVEVLDLIATKRKELAGDGTGLDTAKSDILNKAQKDAEKRSDKEQKDNLERMLGEYTSFLDKKAQLEAQYDEDIKALQEAAAGATTEEERAKIQRTIEQRKASYQQEVKSLKKEETEYILSSSDAYIAIFTNASSMSRKSLNATIKMAKQLMAVVKGESEKLPEGITQEVVDRLRQSPEELAGLYSQIFEMQEAYNKEANYPFSAFVTGFGDLKKSGELAKKAIEETDEKQSEVLQKQAEAAKKNGMQMIANGAVEATNALSNMVEMLKRLAEASGDSKLAEMAGQMGALMQNLSAAGQGAASGGWIGAIVSGVMDMITQTFEAFVNKAAEIKEFEDNRLDFTTQYRMAMLELSDEFDKSWGNRGLAKVQDAAVKAEDALKQYNDYVNKTADSAPEYEESFKSLGIAIFGLGIAGLANLGGLEKTATNEWKGAMEAYEKGYNQLQSMQVKTMDHSDWANFWGKQDEYTSLKDLVPEMWDADGMFDAKAAQQFLDTNTQISDEQRKQIQQAIDLKNKYDEAMAAIEEEIDSTFGYLGDSFTDALVDAIQNGTNAWENFRDAGSKAIETLGSQLAYELFMATQMDAFKEAIKGIYTDTSLTSEEKVMASMSAMSDFFDTAQQGVSDAQDFMERYKEIASQSGFDIWGAGDDTSLTGAVKGVSEETASLVAGQMNAIRINQMESTAILRQQLMSLSTIAQNTSYNFHLAKLTRIVTILEGGQTGDPLRPYGRS